MPKMTGCAFTGHRPQKFPWRYNEDDRRCIDLKAAIMSQIERLAAEGVTQFYSGMADGSDIWLFQAVLSLREKHPELMLHCILPCEGQANSVTYTSRTYYDGCMIDRNRQLVDSAEILLAVYNGGKRSGTALNVHYARQRKRKIILLNPITLEITREKASD